MLLRPENHASHHTHRKRYENALGLKRIAVQIVGYDSWDTSSSSTDLVRFPVWRRLVSYVYQTHPHRVTGTHERSTGNNARTTQTCPCTRRSELEREARVAPRAGTARMLTLGGVPQLVAREEHVPPSHALWRGVHLALYQLPVEATG